MGDYEDMAQAAIPVLIVAAVVFAIMVVGAVGLGWWLHA
jgi:uncharacterized ion transporter superfamily protein YfcC